MAGFDFIDVAVRGYKTVWEKRADIAQVAALPFFIKAGSFAAIIFLGMETNFLRQGLVLLPSYFAEGFLMAYVICMVTTGGKIGSTKDAEPYARDLTAATIIYVLIKMALSFVAGMTLQEAAAEATQQAETPEPSLQMFFLMLATLAFLIWAFRLMWLYVPAAMGISALNFLKRIPEYSVSFQMIGVWLICFIPTGFLLIFLHQFLAAMLGHSADNPSEVLSLIMIPLQSAMEIFVALVSSVGMAYGVQQIFEKDAKR